MINATVLSAILTIIYITVITVAGELYPPLKEFLAKNFSHHWIGKSITAILVFVVFAGLLLVLKPKIKTAFLLNLLSAISIVSALILFSFFAWESFR
ncbi:hypothetical protein A3D81_01750 [Candidatus Curtissbacteria bacterium RIFCSPHIGHO2_02_FULL_40_17]|uniref:Uncharacterized protein n=3 Tax=Microgenomates group TaxID=1794810 RepID=A0A1F7JX94_9BACT|nr:MAG: hypothetical protein A3D81_01750 [Candidatus Curtissbacteria bacterium RIFCSPHIGHO2_02_FULL_40_17]OGE05060.1 MAG: hypothetical protein A3F45_02510 [Candidatus Curtissbacteria bacterium RIFCSPHIGHO2_12_FULL_41_17]OGK60207.1 MAG: hypothetical protein A3I56_04830 [Candidatus Roizmanbacteria bacterium RIFCSPLOWO2_02_FULL_43_10]